MEKKYLKNMNECINNDSDEAVFDKYFDDEMILDQIYKLHLKLAEYLNNRDYYTAISDFTSQEISRLENSLGRC